MSLGEIRYSWGHSSWTVAYTKLNKTNRIVEDLGRVTNQTRLVHYLKKNASDI